MLFMFRGGVEKSRMVINPPELGRLDLDLTIRHGHIHANFGAESLAVKEIIEANLSQLRNQLSDQGFIVDKFEVMVGLSDKEFKESEMWAEQNKKGSKSGKGSEKEVDGLTTGNDPVTEHIIGPKKVSVHV